MDLKEADILGDEAATHWYYRSKAEAMTRLLGKVQPLTILDVGAGSGFFTRYLLENSSAREACCVDTSYDKDSDAIYKGKPIRFRRSIQKVDADLVLLMDVLEHVDDDVGLLSSYIEKVPQGTRFLISVPAFQFLWSAHDIFLDHKRRYALSQIETVARQAGLSVTKGAYYFGIVFPIAAATRLYSGKRHTRGTPARSQLSKHHPLMNWMLGRLCKLEMPVMRWNRIAGLTAFCLAQKI